MQSEGKFRSMAPELYSASVSLTFAFGVGCGGWGTSCSASHKACIEMNCFLGVTMVPYSHHGNYTNTAFLRKQVQWSWLHILFFSFLSRAPWRVFLGQGRLPALWQPQKDSPSVNEDYQYAPLGFASPPVVFQVVWSVCAFVACEAT